ncbi:MAG TPA: DNA mismatch repair endonuclease MutL, partial [Pyrinomonadaceae bacterium]|nr:DNA mismatch repair endonuclease MutL [Pyrinomonadaceae bacterium]
VELVTKTADTDAATRVYIEGGRLVDVKEIGRSQGTTITVRDLFFNTPARRKFMRSEATENYHLTSIVTHYALANPQIAFTLTGNGREVLRLSPAKDLRERAYQIFGAQMIESLLPVDGGREFVAKISGFVSAPRERRTTRDGQYFFINGRFVRDKIIAGGLLEGFRAVLPHGSYPVAFLFLEIPLEEIDVNVHPAKTEVRFRRSEAVKEVIGEAIRAALRNAGIVAAQEPKVQSREFADKIQPKDLLAEFRGQSTEQDKIEQTKIEFPLEIQPPEIGNQQSMTYEKSFENLSQTSIEPVEPQNFEIPMSSTDFEEPVQTRENYELTITNDELKDEKQLSVQHSALSTSLLVDSGAKIPKSIEVENLSSSKIRPIGQLHESFIIATDDEGMLLIDQHVAHERILFDKFRRGENERKIESQNLLLPETIDLTPAQSVAFDLVEAELENCGFGLMRLSGRTVAIKSVPTDLPASEVRNLFAEILETIASDKRGNARETLRDHIAASLACKAAVKINMKLTPEKMQWMIDKLLTTSSPTTCPHGRPVILRLTMKDIERGFHRT